MERIWRSAPSFGYSWRWFFGYIVEFSIIYYLTSTLPPTNYSLIFNTLTPKTERDIEQFENLRLLLANDQKAAYDFLVKAGIIATKGNLKVQYR